MKHIRRWVRAFSALQDALFAQQVKPSGEVGLGEADSLSCKGQFKSAPQGCQLPDQLVVNTGSLEDGCHELVEAGGSLCSPERRVVAGNVDESIDVERHTVAVFAELL